MASDSDFVKVLEAHHGERHLVVLQAFPDPDAIASAFAHHLICANFGIETTLVYSGKISHRQNAALVKLLGIELILYSDLPNLEQYAGAVFVDNQGTTAEEIVKTLEVARIPTVMVIDHHERQDRLKAEFCDIRHIGATATIYSQYLEHNVIPFDKARREHVLVATALMHGILTDTNYFLDASPEDFAAASFLSHFKDNDILGQIMSRSRSKQTMEIIRRALGNRVVIESFSLAGIGYLRAEDRDAIPQAADFLLTEENIHTAIVYGIVTHDNRQETVIGSMRTSNIGIAPDQFIKDALGKSDAERYYGGGKAKAGGFDIPIGFLSGDHSEEYRKLKWQVCDEQIRHKFMVKIGVDQTPREE